MEIIPSDDLKIGNEVIVNRKVINQFYNEINTKIYKSVKSKIERLILLLNKYYEENKDKISSELIKRNIKKEILDEFKNNFNKYLKKHFKVLNKKIQKIYYDILKKINMPNDKILKNNINIEDVPELIYIGYKLIGDHIFDNYKHIVIDEAQDYDAFAFYNLKCIFKSHLQYLWGYSPIDILL